MTEQNKNRPISNKGLAMIVMGVGAVVISSMVILGEYFKGERERESHEQESQKVKLKSGTYNYDKPNPIYSPIGNPASPLWPGNQSLHP